MNRFWIALLAAGALGTVARFVLLRLCSLHEGIFPWGTLIVNSMGCLLFGFLWGVAHQRQILSPEIKTILLVGFLGAFTTFSTFAFETVELFQNSKPFLAALNSLSQNGVGFLCIWAGTRLAHFV